MDRFECEARQGGYQTVAGVDEAGRGPMAGPVVAAAVVFPAGYVHPDIRDSKRLTPRVRERLCLVIEQDALAVGLGVVEPSVIDAVNIRQATLLAMEEAVSTLAVTPDFLLVDGRDRVPVSLPQRTIIRGDSLSVSVAAASIVAKVSRDRIMDLYDRQFPVYRFRKNKGYATAEHQRAIWAHGLCKIHRQSFRLHGGNVAGLPLFAAEEEAG